MTIPTITSFEQVDTTGVSHILLDIEGTTCPVEFVSEVLFPYARDHLEEFLHHQGGTRSVMPLLEQTSEAWRLENDPAAPQWPGGNAGVLPYLQWLISIDRKFPPLKELQGLLWEKGYGSGELKPELFPDVPPMLRRWKNQGIILVSYSSGSVKAQKLLYQHSSSGDLRQNFLHWLDIRIGRKNNQNSYRKINKIIGPRESMKNLFISDSADELEAAAHEGFQSIRRCHG